MSERTCAKCGTAVPADHRADTCPDCGELLPAPATSVPVFEVAPYQAVSGTSVLGVVAMLVAGLVAALFVGGLASGIGQLFYLVFLFPIGIGFGVGAAMLLAARATRMHSPGLAGLLGLWCGGATMVAMHFSNYLWFLGNLDLPPDLTPSFVQYLNLVATHGVRIAGLNLGYYGTIIYWLVEAAVVAGIVFACCVGQAVQPFCPDCDRWKEERTYGPFLGDAQSAQELVQAGEVARLDELDAHEGAELVLVAAVCPRCEEDGTIDVKLNHITRTKDEKTVTELCNITYPGEALAILRELDRARRAHK